MSYAKRRNIIVIAVILCVVAILLVGVNIFKKINSKEYKLGKLGYSNEEIKIILNTKNITFDEVIKLGYKKNLTKIINEKYFIKTNLNEYLEYMDTNPTIEGLNEVTPTDIVAIVNVNANNDFYTNTTPTDISKGYLMLVNKFNYLNKDFVIEDLVKMGLEFSYAGNEISNEVYVSFKKLVRDAKKEGLTIIANSSYRSYENQEKVYNQKKANLGTEQADLIATHPGYSEHQTGLAIDVSTPGYTTETFDTSDEFKWLIENAHKYGFILRYPKDKKYLTGIEYESWHYRYVGVDMATKIYNENITFDEYYEYYLR